MDEFETKLLKATIQLLAEGKYLADDELKKLPETILLQALIDLLIAKGIFSEEELISSFDELTMKMAKETILAELKTINPADKSKN